MITRRPALFLVAIILGLSTSRNHADSPKRIEITAERFNYAPDKITLKKGEPVILVLRSTDVTHGLKVEELNIKSDINKDKATEIQITPEEAGHFVGKCAHFCGNGHGTMTLQIDVVP